ncbi:ribose operon transcriptional repressor RbsR [Barrientosiimonas marina]|uniref:LacI family DNA-binding transcriptional regulator n=1 Tax=Lentibacillus kimchii TaxID=1542911 RepID=A0ABW2UYR8_9BACI
MATIRDVARYANVSTATVSRVMNRNGYADAETSRRVKEAIEQLDYRPNDVARSLFKGRSGMIALLVPDITNPFFPELARAVEDKTNLNGYSFVLCNTDNDVAKQLNYLNALQQKSIDGFIIVSSSLTPDNMQSLQVPAVALDRVISPSMPSVTVNNRSGARQAVDHLKAIGCRRIAHVAGLEYADNAAQRMRGYLDAVKQEDWFDSRYIVSGAYHFNQAQEAVETMLSNNPDIDGIFAGNDMMGAGVLHAAASLGKRIPDDLAVVGFDGIALSETVTPALTTMTQPIYDMGAKAADMLINQIETADSTVMTEEFNVQLAERESTLRKAATNEQ